jgi:chemotaxis protein MotB
MKNKIYKITNLLLIVLFLSGCQTLEKSRKYDFLEQENKKLKEAFEQLEKAKNVELNEKEKELLDLEIAKQELTSSLKKELDDFQAKLKMTERGLVITFLAEIFFDSGKDVIKESSKPILKRVALILNDSVKNSYLAVEGYTDNDPIKYSGWRSNWELSSARALAVLHYLIDDCQVSPDRFSVIGYSEFHPVASNDTFEGKKQNRRVEIVILPSKVKKVKGQ